MSRELFHSASVNCAPGAFRTSRSEANLVTLSVDGFAQSIDPSKTERFVDSLWPSYSRSTGILFVKANPLFRTGSVIFLQPSPKLRRFGKENELLICGFHTRVNDKLNPTNISSLKSLGNANGYHVRYCIAETRVPSPRQQKHAWA